MTDTDIVPVRDVLAEIDMREARMHDAHTLPGNDEDLAEWIWAYCGLKIPTVAVCPGHCAPITPLADAFFERELDQVWLASRGSAKTTMLALLHHLNLLFKTNYEVASVGAIREQAARCNDYLRGFGELEWFHEDVAYSSQVLLKYKKGGKAEILSGTTAGVNCLVSTTSIDTCDGPRMIGELVGRSGFDVYAWDNGKVVQDEVAGVWYVGKGVVYKVVTGMHTLYATSEHPIRLEDGSWKAVCKLRQGDAVIVKGGKNFVLSVTRQEGYRDVYDMTTIRYHNYFANGINVSNSPHPHLLAVDEVELLPWPVLQQAFSMPMSGGGHQAITVLTSTRKERFGTMQRLLDKVENDPGFPYRLYTWCVAGDEPVMVENGTVAMKDLRAGDKVWALENDRFCLRRVEWAGLTRRQAPVVRVRLADGKSVRVTEDHLILTQDGWIRAGLLDSTIHWCNTVEWKPNQGGICETVPVRLVRVVEVEPAGCADVYDCSVGGAHNFVAGGIVVHNCLWECVEKCTLPSCEHCQRAVLRDHDGETQSFWDICRGKAKKADGFIQLQDVWRKFSMMDYEIFDSEWLNARPGRVGRVFKGFNEDDHVRRFPIDLNLFKRTAVVMDMGWAKPLAVLFVGLDARDNVYCFDSLYRAEWPEEDVAAALKAKFDLYGFSVAGRNEQGDEVRLYNRKPLYIDVRAPRAINRFGKLGFDAQAVGAPIDPGIKWIRDMIRNRRRRTGAMELLIHADHCKPLIDEMFGLHNPVDRDNKATSDKLKGEDHLVDCLRYTGAVFNLIESEAAPVRRTIVVPTPVIKVPTSSAWRRTVETNVTQQRSGWRNRRSTWRRDRA